ncbi:MAG: SDR family oxidoreductase [Ruminococcus flavefaciens]|nr:SDR family oxidoreductase [Ruminococcus flavefaciens]
MEKAILVTGASSGIGSAVSEYLSERGYFVVLVARNKDRLNQISERLSGGNLIIPYDLSDLEHIEDIFTACKDNGVKLDGLVHCAGINNDIPIRANDVEIMKEVTTVNYYSFVELGKYFNKKKYSNDQASIVAISSSAAESCGKGMCTYAASKSALNASVKVMGKEFLKRRQRVNAILPTFVDTPMAARMDDALGDLDNKVAGQPLGLIEPRQIAYLVEFLISDKASYITGACIPVSAGAIF